MANETIYPYGTNGQLPSSIGVINDLTTGGVNQALSAEMGKELGETVNGIPEVTGTWALGGYQYKPDFGSTFDGTVNTAYPYGNIYHYCKLTVKEGDKIHVTARHNGSYCTVVIVGSNNNVLTASGYNAVDSDYTITEDGFAYITNKDEYTGKVAKIYASDGLTQRTTALETIVEEINTTLDALPNSEEFSQLEEDVRGYTYVGTWYNGVWADTSGLSVGDTYSKTSPATDYSSAGNYRYCAKTTVPSGKPCRIISKCNTYHRAIVITKTDGEVVYISELDNNEHNYLADFEYDVIVYANAHKDAPTKSVTINQDGNKQKAQHIYNSFNSRVIEGRQFSLPLQLFGWPYVNSVDYFWEMGVPSSNHQGCTGWVALPKGTYIKNTTRAGVMFQSDTPLFHKDYAKNGDNVTETTLSAEEQSITVNKNFVWFTIQNSADSLSLELTPTAITADAVEQPNNKLAHVSHRTDDFILYLPMKDRFMVAEIKKYVQASSQYPHYGISIFYDSGAGLFMPRMATALTRGGETECAIGINGTGIDNYQGGHNTYIGGHQHGYERIVEADTKVYIDGSFKGVSDKFSADVNAMFELSTHTQYLAPTNIGTENEVIIADLYKRWRVVDGKLHLYNRVVWNIPVHVTKGELSMFCIYRHEGGDTNNPYLTCMATRNDNTFVYTTTDGWDTSSPTDGASIISTPAKATLQEQWGESGYIVRQEIFENNARDNGGLFINTNDGGTYNKMYFEIGSNFDVVEGDELFSHAVLSIE